MPEFTLENTIFTLTSEYESKGVDQAIQDLDKLDAKVESVFNSIIKQQLQKTGKVAKDELDKVANEVKESFKKQSNDFTEFYKNLTKNGLAITEAEAKQVFNKINVASKNAIDKQQQLQKQANEDKKKLFLDEATNYKAHADKLAAIDKDFAATRKKLISSGLKLSDREILDTFRSIKSIQQSQQNEIAQAANANSGVFGQIKNAAAGQLQNLGIDTTKLAALGTTGAAALAPLAAAFAAFKLGEFAEQQELVIAKFETLSGNRGLAIQLAEDLDTLANKTGISGDRLEDAAAALLKFNVPAKEIPNRLKEFAGIAAATGASLEDLANKFGLISSRGFATTRELKQFEREGIPIYENLAIATGKTVEQLRKLKQVSDEDVTKAFQEMTKEGSKFSTALDNQANTLSGLKARLKETFGNLLEDIGTPFLDFTNTVLSGVISLIDKFKPYIVSALNFTSTSIYAFIKDIQNGFAGLRAELTDPFTGGVLKKVNEDLIKQFGKEVSDKFDNGEFAKQGIDLQFKIIEERKKNDEKQKEIEKLNIRIEELRGKQRITNSISELNSLERYIQRLELQISKKTGQIQDLSKFAIGFVKNVLDNNNSNVQNNNIKPSDTNTDDLNAQSNRLKKLIETRDRLKEEFIKLSAETRAQYQKLLLEPLFDPKNIKDQNDVLEKQTTFQNDLNKYAEKLNDLFKKVNEFNKSRGKLDPLVIPIDIQLNTDNILAEYQKAQEEILKALQRDAIPFLQTARPGPSLDEANKRATEEGFSKLGSKKEQEDEEKKKAEIRKQTLKKDKDLIIENAKSIAEDLLQIEADKIDREISLQEKKIDSLKELAALGNAEQLQAEEDRLNELNNKKEKFVEKQKELAAIEIATSNAVTISNLVASIAKDSFTTTPIVAIANVIALVATIAGTIAAIKSQLSANSFSEGKDRVQGIGTRKSDSIPSMLSVDEGVIDAENNEKMDYADNKTKSRRYLLGKMLEQNRIPEYQLNKAYVNHVFSTKNIENKIDRSNKLLTQLVEKGGKTRIHVTASIDKNLRDAAFIRKATNL
jgi:hypothetical protein